jgi:hypothetical protein
MCNITNATGSAVSANVSNVAVNCVSTDLKATGQLNDTGIDWCSEYIITSSTSGFWDNKACNLINWVANWWPQWGQWGDQQDAFFGRDKQAREGTLVKTGGGMAGFDFTKIGASGKVLTKQGEAWSDNGTEAAGTQWDCVRDNVTQLVWEVKRNDANHLRHMSHSYSWFNESAATNGGNAGIETPSQYKNGDPITGLTCKGTAQNKCNTQSYVAAVNQEGLCGKTDWRMPNTDELRSLLHFGLNAPTIDSNYFPNTVSDGYWSSTFVATVPNKAWEVTFDNEGEYYDLKERALHVRLVRSGQ